MAPSKKSETRLPKTKFLLMILLSLIGILCMCVGMWGCQSRAVSDYPSDNIFEELAEFAFEEYTGVDVDFSPFSPED